MAIYDHFSLATDRRTDQLSFVRLWGVRAMLRKAVSSLRIVMSDPKRKSVSVMFSEILQLALRDRDLPVHYYSALLYRDDFPGDIFAFVGFRNINRAYDCCNRVLDTELWTSLLDNKLIFDRFFGLKGIPVPEALGYCAQGLFVVPGNEVLLATEQGVVDGLRLVLEQARGGSVFAKPIDGGQGRGCFLLDPSNLQKGLSSPSVINTIRKGYIFQKAIEQHPVMASLHPQSVNTVRIDTWRSSSEGKASAMSALVRMGSKGSRIDNAAAGGCFVGVNLTDGRMKSKGFVEPQHGASILDRHPDTGILFEGFLIPFFREAVQLAEDAAELIPLTAVGWDIAIGTNGPILIEGNPGPGYDVRMSEMAYGGYYDNPVFLQFARRHAPRLYRIAAKKRNNVDKGSCGSR